MVSFGNEEFVDTTHKLLPDAYVERSRLEFVRGTVYPYATHLSCTRETTGA